MQNDIASRELRVDLFARMLLAVRQSGVIALELQGRVANERKVDATVLPNDSEALRIRRAAKTVVDEVVQEVIILAALDVMDPHDVALDAEEITPSCSLFARSSDVDSTLVIDPIDGTLEYLANRDSYSICVAMARAGVLTAAFVYFPVQDILYYLNESAQAMMAADVSRHGTRRARRMTSNAPGGSSTVFINGRVPRSVQDSLLAAGYNVLDDTMEGRGVRGCVLACLSGNAVAYVSHTRQMRDIVLGGLVGATSGGYALDWTGAKLLWPPGGRVPRAIFGTGKVPQSLLECLRSDATAGA
jgi:fructose-1,6-bisphosphatase/inositol monophosphatase family enzyme